MQNSVDEVLDFLKEPKSRKEIEINFTLSNSESWHLVKWLEKANLVTVMPRITKHQVQNRKTLFKSKEQ